MRLAVLLLFLLSGTPGTSGRWWWIFSEPDAVWFVDAPSIVVDGDTREFWRQNVYRKPSRGASYRIVHQMANCRTRRLITLAAVSYSAKGDVIDSYTMRPNAEAKNIVPDSTGESLLLFICSDPDKWDALDALPVFRPPDRVAHDIYILIGFGLTDYQAALMASVNVRDHPDLIQEAIEKFVKPEHRSRVRAMYGLPAPVKHKT